MSKERELQDAFKKLLDKDAITFSATVKSVDKTKGTCIVSDGQLEFKVRLSSVINESKEKFFLYPKPKSIVLVGCVKEDLNQLYVAQYSTIEELRFKVANCDFCIDETGFNFKKENESLKSLLLELITAIKNLKFTTTSGTTLQMINVADFLLVENKFKSLLKDI